MSIVFYFCMNNLSFIFLSKNLKLDCCNLQTNNCQILEIYLNKFLSWFLETSNFKLKKKLNKFRWRNTCGSSHSWSSQFHSSTISTAKSGSNQFNKDQFSIVNCKYLKWHKRSSDNYWYRKKTTKLFSGYQSSKHFYIQNKLIIKWQLVL